MKEHRSFLCFRHIYSASVDKKIQYFDNMLSTMTKYMGDMFVIGFRIFLPVFACMMIMNCILGIMAKVAPQMNMFSVGIQLKIIAGFIVLFLIVYLIPNIANFIITEIKTMVVSIIDGMY